LQGASHELQELPYFRVAARDVKDRSCVVNQALELGAFERDAKEREVFDQVSPAARQKGLIRLPVAKHKSAMRRSLNRQGDRVPIDGEPTKLDPAHS
jgi:hypothetical protein